MGVKIQGVNHGYTLELYTATYTGNLLYNGRNRPIQHTIIVPRDCIAIQRVQRVQRAPIQPRYTGYSLYTIQPYTPTLCMVTISLYTDSRNQLLYTHTLPTESKTLAPSSRSRVKSGK